MPDLNVANPEVTAALDDVARFWLEDMGVDGFRLDAARHLIEDGAQLENTPGDVRLARRTSGRGSKAVKPDALIVGEVWDATSTAAQYVRTTARSTSPSTSALQTPSLGSIRLGDADTLTNVQAEVADAYPAGGYASFLTNHDQNRTMDELARNRDAAGLAATLLLTNPGVPFIYYGEELGLRGRKPDEEIRTPMPWNATPPGLGFTTGQPWEAFAPRCRNRHGRRRRTATRSRCSATTGALTRLRAEHSALRTGELISLEAEPGGVYAFLRHDAADVDRGRGEPVGRAGRGRQPDPRQRPAVRPDECPDVARHGRGSSARREPGGRVRDYRPFDHLGPREAVVIRLSP